MLRKSVAKETTDTKKPALAGFFNTIQSLNYRALIAAEKRAL